MAKRKFINNRYRAHLLLGKKIYIYSREIWAAKVQTSGENKLTYSFLRFPRWKLTSHDVTKIKTTKLLILTNFCSEWVFVFAIGYAWISKLLLTCDQASLLVFFFGAGKKQNRDAWSQVKLLRDAAFCMTAELVKKWLISGNLAIWTGSCIRKSIILMFV